MRPFAVLLMVLTIAASPALAGLSAVCAPDECTCAAMAGGHGPHLTVDPRSGCGCPSAADGTCCVSQTRSPDRPLAGLPLLRTGVAAPTIDGCAPAVVTLDAADGRRHHVYLPPFDRQAPPPLAYLLHQRFLI